MKPKSSQKTERGHTGCVRRFVRWLRAEWHEWRWCACEDESFRRQAEWDVAGALRWSERAESHWKKRNEYRNTPNVEDRYEGR